MLQDTTVFIYKNIIINKNFAKSNIATIYLLDMKMIRLYALNVILDITSYIDIIKAIHIFHYLFWYFLSIFQKLVSSDGCSESGPDRIPT